MILRPVAAVLPFGLRGRAGVDAGRRAGALTLERSAALTGAPLPEDGSFPRDEEGAPLPFGPEQGWHWSTTNTEGLTASVVAPAAVAIDAEWLERPRFEAAREHYTPDELELLGAEDREAVLRLWTAKEAVLKLTGRGMADLGHCRLVEPANGTTLALEHDGVRYGVRVLPVGAHVVSLACAAAFDVELVELEEPAR